MTWKTYSFITSIILCITFCAFLTTRGETASPSEYEIKAAFIYNFSKFIEWPSSAFANANSPMVIGILGKDPFGSTLEDAVKDKNVDGRKLVIKRYKNVKDAGACHILFISSSEQDQLSKILDSLKGTNVLTVGEMKKFAQRKGMIGFVMHNDKVGLEINIDSAKQAKLKISSKLLNLAKVIGD